MASTDRFPEALRSWRRQAGVSQAELDARLGRSAGTVAQFEVGRLKPPDRATCSAIAVALGVSEAEVWTIARDERLRLADPDAFADLAQEHARARLGSPLVEAEVELVNLLRVLDQERGQPEGTVARIVSAIVFSVALQAVETEGAPERLSSRLVWALARVGELPSRRLRRVLVAILRTVEAVVDASAVPGPSPEDDASGR